MKATTSPRKLPTKFNDSPQKQIVKNDSAVSFGAQETEVNIDLLTPEDLIAKGLQIVQAKPPNMRKKKDILLLSKLIRIVKYFKENEIDQFPDVQKFLSRKALYQQFQPNTLVFQKGDTSLQFIIILNGTVQIFMPLQQKVLLEDGTEASDVIEEEITILKSLDSFGEVGLLKSQNRNSSARTLTTCDFLVLDKIDFNHVFSRLKSAIFQKKLEFVRQIPLFRELTAGTLEFVIYNFDKASFIQNQCVTRENTDANFVYAIREGTFRITKKFCIPRSCLKTFQQAVDIDNMQQQKVLKEFTIAVLAQGELLCDIDCLLNEKCHFSIYCESQAGELLKIDRINFLRRLQDQNENPEVERFLNTYIDEKIQWRNDKIKEIKQTIFEKQNFVAGVFSNKALLFTKQSETQSNLQIASTEPSQTENAPILINENNLPKLKCSQTKTVAELNQFKIGNSVNTDMFLQKCSSPTTNQNNIVLNSQQFVFNKNQNKSNRSKSFIETFKLRKNFKTEISDINNQSFNNLNTSINNINTSFNNRDFLQQSNNSILTDVKLQQNIVKQHPLLIEIQDQAQSKLMQIKTPATNPSELQFQEKFPNQPVSDKLPILEQKKSFFMSNGKDLKNTNKRMPLLLISPGQKKPEINQDQRKQKIQNQIINKFQKIKQTQEKYANVFNKDHLSFNRVINSKLKAFKKITNDKFNIQKQGDDFGWISNQIPIFELKKLNLIKTPVYNVYDWRFSPKSNEVELIEAQNLQQLSSQEQIQIQQQQLNELEKLQDNQIKQQQMDLSPLNQTQQKQIIRQRQNFLSKTQTNNQVYHNHQRSADLQEELNKYKTKQQDYYKTQTSQIIFEICNSHNPLQNVEIYKNTQQKKFESNNNVQDSNEWNQKSRVSFNDLFSDELQYNKSDKKKKQLRNIFFENKDILQINQQSSKQN